MPPFSVLTVCLGNICRSPMAERLLARSARQLAGADSARLLLVSSAGTGNWHAGSAMQPQAARQVRARGGDPDRFAARQVRREHLESADLILTATAEQVDYLLRLCPDAQERTFVMGEFGRLAAEVDPADLPEGGDPEGVHARGVALVAAVHLARSGKPAEPADDLDDPYGESDAFYARTADRIQSTTEPLARLLLG